MPNADEFIAARENVIAALASLVTADERITACWLQGSLADGSSDALSDIDAYLAVPDEEFDAVYAERRSIVERLGRVLFLVDGLIPGLQTVHAIIAGPAKLDLFFERLSHSPEVKRPAVVVLVDKAGLGNRLQSGWEPPLDSVSKTVTMTFSGTLQGGTWPIRLLLRGQWAMFASVELRLINENLATLMAVQVYPRLLFKNPLTMTRLLPPAQRLELEEMSMAVMEGVVRRDLPSLRDTHLRVFRAFVREGKAALAGLGLPYPGTDEGERGMQEMYQLHWPAEVPQTA